MKKLLLILILTLASLVSIITVEGQSLPTNDLDDKSFNMIDYFKNLNEYSPENSWDGCGYVSLIQYLSYYDTFLNDDIIPEQYDRNQGNTSSLREAIENSPGVLRDSYDIMHLYEDIQEKKDTNFMLELMRVVNEFQAENINDYVPKLALHQCYLIMDYLFEDIEVDFEYYFNDTYLPSGDIDYANETELQWFYEYTINKIDTENPVILNIIRYDDNVGFTGPHAVVAYDYDENGIYVNMGYDEDRTYELLGEDYYIYGVGIMDLTNIPEKHSNNYIVNNEEYCGCGHKHQYNNNYEILSHTKHNAECMCGMIKEEMHSYIMDSNNIYCSYCNWNKDMSTCLNENEIQINSFNYNDFTEFSVSLFNNVKNHEYYKKIFLHQAGSYNINILTTDDIYIVILRENNGLIKLIKEQKIEEDSNVQVNLENGRYIVGYYGISDNNNVSLTLKREITKSGYNYFITDPDKATKCGSQINLAEILNNENSKSYRQKNILEGFTRIIYLSTGESRQDFYWYSSDETIANVTGYGTVLARSVITNSTVKIMAVNKNNPSIVYMDEFNIINDSLDYINNPIDIIISMTINIEEGMYIDLNSYNVPINILQYYSWYSSNYDYATCNYYGRINAKEAGRGKSVLITGSYRYNNRVKIKVYVNIE